MATEKRRTMNEMNEMNEMNDNLAGKGIKFSRKRGILI